MILIEFYINNNLILLNLYFEISLRILNINNLYQTDCDIIFCNICDLILHIIFRKWILFWHLYLLFIWLISNNTNVIYTIQL